MNIKHKDHDESHKKWTRRNFLYTMGWGTGIPFWMGNQSVQSSANFLNQFFDDGNDNILIIVRLKGGNDGLNTCIPLMDYANYRQSRQQIYIPENKVIKLNNDFGLHPQLKGLKGLYDQGALKVINNVGYENQNLSHFRSSDIWATASDASVIENSGWLGRRINNLHENYLTSPPEKPLAVNIGSLDYKIFDNKDSSSLSVGIDDIETFLKVIERGALHSLVENPECGYEDQLNYITQVYNSSFTYGNQLKDAYEKGTSIVDHSGDFGKQLELVARLIKGELGAKFYLVTLDGFDTHANQTTKHDDLMKQLGDGIEKFMLDVNNTVYEEKIVGLTVSEFGRRIQENSSGGTDHGSASCMFMFGAGVNGAGVLGGEVKINEADNFGNLPMKVAYRDVYHSILQDWLCVSSGETESILFNNSSSFEHLGLLCGGNTNTNELVNQGVRLYIRNQGSLEPQLVITTKKSLQGSLRILTTLGRTVSIRNINEVGAGTFMIDLNLPHGGIFYYELISKDLKKAAGKILKQ